MKNYILYFVLGLFLSCSKDDNNRNNNPYIPEYNFSVSLDRNLPLYSGLNTPVNPILITNENAGVKGIIVMKISDTDFRAWEANCPNQYPQECSRMTINGLNAKCPCDGIEYSIFTGVGSGPYTMKSYRVEVLGDIVRIYN